MSDLLIRYDEPIKDYHADKAYLGSTDLKLAAGSARLFYERVEQGEVPADSDSSALELGRLWHTLRELGVEQFYDLAAVAPPEMVTNGGAMSTKKDAKEWAAEQAAAGKIVMTRSQADTLGVMQERFAENTAAVLLAESVEVREASIRWQGAGDIRLKCRPDAIAAGGCLLDWKSTREQYPLDTFWRAVKSFGYGLSAALYEQGCTVAGLAHPPMHFVVTSTVHPYETQVITLPSSFMDYCRRKLDEVVLDIARRRMEGDWLPVGYGEITEITMPGFGDRSFVSSFVE